MQPATPVIPGANLPELAYGAGQEQYDPLPAVRLDGPEGEIVTRWELTDEDRAAIAAGGSVYLHIFTFGMALQPVRVTTESPQLDVLTPDGIRRIG